VDSVSAHQLLIVYSWFVLSALVFLMALIARFYERLSGQRTYYGLFTVPVIAFAGASLRLTALDQLAGDAWASILLLIGGSSLAALCVHVYRHMTSGR
jgi:hypothetical protein